MANKGAVLQSGSYLDEDDYLVSPSGRFFAIVQSNGILGVYRGSEPSQRSPQRLVWQTTLQTPPGGRGIYADLHANGELCVLRDYGHGDHLLVWQSGQRNNNINGCRLEMQDDGDLCVYHGSTGNERVWGIGSALGSQYCRVQNTTNLDGVFKVSWNNPGDSATYETEFARVNANSTKEIDLAPLLAFDVPIGARQISPIANCYITWRVEAKTTTDHHSGASFRPATPDQSKDPFVAIIHIYREGGITPTNSNEFSVIPWTPL